MEPLYQAGQKINALEFSELGTGEILKVNHHRKEKGCSPYYLNNNHYQIKFDNGMRLTLMESRLEPAHIVKSPKKPEQLPFALIVLLVIILQSCVTQKACNTKYPPKIITRDSVSYKEIIRNVEVPVPGETVTLIQLVNCDSSGKAQMPKKTIKTGKTTATAQIKDGVLEVNCQTDSLILEIQARDRIIETLKTTTEIIHVDPINWNKILCGFLLILITILIIIKIVKW